VKLQLLRFILGNVNDWGSVRKLWNFKVIHFEDLIYRYSAHLLMKLHPHLSEQELKDCCSNLENSVNKLAHEHDTELLQLQDGTILPPINLYSLPVVRCMVNRKYDRCSCCYMNIQSADGFITWEWVAPQHTFQKRALQLPCLTCAMKSAVDTFVWIKSPSNAKHFCRLLLSHNSKVVKGKVVLFLS